LAIAAVLEGASREDAAPPGRGALGLDDLDHLAGLMHGMVRRPERHHVVGPSQADLAVRGAFIQVRKLVISAAIRASICSLNFLIATALNSAFSASPPAMWSSKPPDSRCRIAASSF
jgi:hypothetical protein